jgi:hypothetical protein
MATEHGERKSGRSFGAQGMAVPRAWRYYPVYLNHAADLSQGSVLCLRAFPFSKDRFQWARGLHGTLVFSAIAFFRSQT